MAKNELSFAAPKACCGCLWLSSGVCGFLLMTGKARQLICGRGADCTVKVKTLEEKERYHELYGKTDYALAHEDGIKASRIRHMPHATFDEMAAWKMYEYDRATDAEIGAKFGLTKSAISAWRRRHNYPANYCRYKTMREREATKPPVGV